MKRIGDLLAALPLPAGAGHAPTGGCDRALLHDLGADLPAGHLHLWGGPRGAGKTSFLLSLVLGAATRGRRALFATYHLSAESVALRLLAMTAEMDPRALASGHLDAAQAARAGAARASLVDLPLWVLESRGLSAPSLEDRLVRMPYRAEVLAVDYLQAVIRPAGQDLGGLVRALSALSSRLHLAIVAAIEAEAEPPEVRGLVDRAGWIAPAGSGGLRRAEVIENRYGPRPAASLRFDEATGALARVHGPDAPS